MLWGLRRGEAFFDGEFGIRHMLFFQAMIFVALRTEVERRRATKKAAVIRAEDVIACFVPFLFLSHFRSSSNFLDRFVFSQKVS